MVSEEVQVDVQYVVEEPVTGVMRVPQVFLQASRQCSKASHWGQQPRHPVTQESDV